MKEFPKIVSSYMDVLLKAHGVDNFPQSFFCNVSSAFGNLLM